MAETAATRARPPGVYVERATKKPRPFMWVKTSVVGFLGVTSRGPVGVPRLITSWEGFLKVYGEPVPEGFLGAAVSSYFRNDGKECYVVRVAHTGDPVDARNAACAALTLEDLRGNPTLTVRAKNEGLWGNGIRISIEPDETSPETLVIEAIEKGGTSAAVKSSRGFEPGALVQLSARTSTEYVTVEKIAVSGRRIYFKTPVAHDYPAEDKVQLSAPGFTMRVEFDGDEEVFRGLNLASGNFNYAPDRVSTDSEYVDVLDAESSSAPPANFPGLARRKSLSGGVDGMESISPADYIGRDTGPQERTGLHSFREVEDVAVLCAPDLWMSRYNSAGFKDDDSVLAVMQEMVAQSESIRNRFVILDTPPDLTPVQAVTWRRQFDSARAAIYYPWVKLSEPTEPDLGLSLMVPPTAVVAGMYASNDLKTGVHKPPANVPIRGALELENDLTRQEQSYLNDDHVNCLVAFPGRGIRIWGARTATFDSSWKYINVRRLFMMIEESVYRNTQWAVFEPNDVKLWMKIRSTLRVAFDGLWRKGYLVGKTADEAFYVKCDEETNMLVSGERAGAAVLTEIGLAAVRPAEFIIVRVSQKQSEEEEFEK